MRSMTWIEFLDAAWAMTGGVLSNCRILYHNAKSGAVPLCYDFVHEFNIARNSVPGAA